MQIAQVERDGITLMVDVAMMRRHPKSPVFQTRELETWFDQWKVGRVTEVFSCVVGIARAVPGLGLLLTCNCCGYTRQFKNHDVAYEKGWAAPPYCLYVLCQHCPASPMLMTDDWRRVHRFAHAQWEAEGRPNDCEET